ncbi:MAG: ABC transporter substrate-binding protein, partial [Acidimicrobiia bacterium]
MKRIRWVALLAIFSMIVAACGGDTADTTTTAADTTTTAAETTTTAPAEPSEEFEGLTLDSGGCDYGGKVESIVAVDEFTVAFNLCSPDPAFMQKAAFTPFGIQPQEHLEATGGAPLDNSIGTGPFVLDQWDRGNQIVFSANRDYYGQQPAFDTLVYRWAT